MSNEIVLLRNALYDAIEARKLLSPPDNFSLTNSFATEKVWLPYKEAEDLRANYPYGVLYLIGLDMDETVIDRANEAVVEGAIQLGYQKALTDTYSVPEVDALVGLVKEIRDTCRTFDNETYAWLRTESMKDENGIPFSFIGAREGNFFEAFFTCFYQFVI